MAPPDPPPSPSSLSDVFPPGSFAGLTPEPPSPSPTDAQRAALTASGIDLSLFAGFGRPAAAENPEDRPVPLLDETPEEATAGATAGSASFSLQKLAASLVDTPPAATPRAESLKPLPAAPSLDVAPFPLIEVASLKASPPERERIAPPVPRAPTAPVTIPPREITEKVASPFQPLAFDPAREPLFTPVVAEEESPALPVPTVTAPLAIPPAHVENPFLDSPAFRPLPTAPVPQGLFAQPPFFSPEPPAPAAPPPVVRETAPGLLVGGAFLVLAGTALACVIPLRLVEAGNLQNAADAASQWSRQSIEFSVVALAAGAASCLALGLGSSGMRRWAPPLIHAAAWVAVLFTLFLLAGVTAALFHQEDGGVLPGGPLAVMAAAGLGVPLALIAYYQRDKVAAACADADPHGRPVPPSAVPARMVIVSALALAVLCAAMLRHRPAFPLYGEVRTDADAAAGWVACAAFFGFTALLAAARSAAGWWFLLIGTLALAADAVITFRAKPFPEFLTSLGRPAGDALPTLPGPPEIWIALPFLPLLLILLMSRRAFAVPASEPSAS